MIKVSIITPSFNQGQFIEQTILSVLNQSYKNVEYIVVDGGSTDNTLTILDKYKDKIDIIISEKDKGQSDAINKGFRLATGTLVGWINSDDILYPDCVANLVKAYESNPDGAIYYCPNLHFIDKDRNIILTKRLDITNKEHLLRINYDVNQQASFYSNELLKRVDYLNEDIQYCMDLDLWLRLLDHAEIIPICQEPQAGFRLWEETKTSTATLQFLGEIRKVLQQNGVRSQEKIIWRIRVQSFRFRVKQILLKLLRKK
ncbi:glycosyltransferase [Bacteroidales bacterium OttesenSCG-928-J19]|nr:glycosyltransferase [Bacteroidales bacterium OttesenSCG-928-J19]